VRFDIDRLQIPHALLLWHLDGGRRACAVGQHEISQQDFCQIFRLTVGQLPACAPVAVETTRIIPAIQ
jgi:hypothetical protein